MSHLDDLAADLDARLAQPDAQLLARYPGHQGGPQPIHTVYVPADQFSAQTPAQWGAQARALLNEHGADPAQLAVILDTSVPLIEEVYDRVRAKLASEPIEDLRIDFEDGYGRRPDQHEDAAVEAAARGLADMTGVAGTPAYTGIRIKSLEAPTRRRSLRTLDGLIASLTDSSGLPDGFVVTLPKVTSVDQVEAMVVVCERLEQRYGLRPGQLRFELQVETPQAIVGPDGTALVACMIHAAAGRCSGLHFGTYDYSAALGIAATYQRLDHPAADHAKSVMQVAAAATGVRLSDGSTNVLPIGDHSAVLAAWRIHGRLVRRSLERGFYQGWDLHPGQLVTRHMATYVFYREGLPATAERLRAYAEGSSRPGFLDEPATARALAAFVMRGVDCGALDEDEVRRESALDPAELARLAGLPVDTGLARFNAASAEEATAALTACCDVPRWVDTVRDRRPFHDVAELLAFADAAAHTFTAADVERALRAHPRIGERASGSGREAELSRGEQAGVGRDAATLAALAEANRAYEERFGQVFLICAAGLSADEILAALRARSNNDDETESQVVADQLRKIALRRLGKLIES